MNITDRIKPTYYHILSLTFFRDEEGQLVGRYRGVILGPEGNQLERFGVVTDLSSSEKQAIAAIFNRDRAAFEQANPSVTQWSGDAPREPTGG